MPRTSNKTPAEEVVPTPEPAETTGAQPETPPAPPEEQPTLKPEPEPKEPELGASGAVTVYDKNKQPFRTYTRELHGENFVELAKEFISDREGFTLR